jgi:methyl-accepting chemotaxis protein
LQASATQQTSAALSQIESGARLAQQNGKTADESVRRIDAAIKEGRDSIQTLVQSVSDGVNNTQASIVTINRLDAVGRKIEKIVDAIALINVQTSMLAVSGAVEAARAGDSGRGFSIVSNNIRNLAHEASANVERAKDTVRGVLEQIGTLRAELNQIVTSTEVEVQNNRSISVVLEKIGVEIESMSASSRSIVAGAADTLTAAVQTAAASRQIATAAEEASAASREAATAATEQSRGAEDLAAAIEEIASLADELKRQNA